MTKSAGNMWDRRMGRLLTLAIIIMLAGSLAWPHITYAANNKETAINLAADYLKTNQSSSGQIIGFGGESQWAAIGFAANSIDIQSIKNPNVSLYEYLLVDKPAPGAAATEWERRILAFNAVGIDASDAGGVNYIQNLINLANGGQLGEPFLINDDFFGILALAPETDANNSIIIQDSLNFILANQSADGGFGYSLTSGSDSNDTAAAIQALLAAKESGFSHANLDLAITNAQQYLLSLQSSDGGFFYDSGPFSTAPDGSSTTWALMALNALGLNDSQMAINATNWLLNNQLPDGGFGYLAAFGSDTFTTSHALVALSGNGWLIKKPSPSPSAPIAQTPTATPPPVVATSAITPNELEVLEPIQAAVAPMVEQLPQNTGQVLGNVEPELASQSFNTWRWLLVTLSISSFAGAGYYGLSYNRSKP